MELISWPSEHAFTTPPIHAHLHRQGAICLRIALCDASGIPSNSFPQGEEAHFYYEFEILRPIEVPSVGIVLRDLEGRVIHGKNSFQILAQVPRHLEVGFKLRSHHVIKLDLAYGTYTYTIGLASAPEIAYDAYIEGSIDEQGFSSQITSESLLSDIGILSVQTALDRRMLHHGITNLSNRITVELETTRSSLLKDNTFTPINGSESFIDTISDIPTVIHITHWKAGSQWIRKILSAAFPEHIVEPTIGNVQFRRYPIQPGKIYPAVYENYHNYIRVLLPENTHRFVVIRDLRDTLVSAYFSLMVSHPIIDNTNIEWRNTLEQSKITDGMLALLENWLPESARIQMSWLEAGEPFICYEDLLDNDVEILEHALIDQCGLPIEREHLREIIKQNRFENLTLGRKRGEEDITSHERKGIVGDWRTYFDERLKKRFKLRYGPLLIATGYERDLDW